MVYKCFHLGVDNALKKTDNFYPAFPYCFRLWTRKEKEIAVVSHSGFLFHTLSAFGNDCHPTVKSEICTQYVLPSFCLPRLIDGRIMESYSPAL